MPRARSLVPAVLFATAMLATSTSELAAQSRFGILLGGNASRLAGIDVGSADLFNGNSTVKDRIGFQAGVYLARSLNKTWSLQPELHYTQKGASFDPNGTAGTIGSLNFNFGYAELPVLLRADLGGQRVHPFVVFGPSVSARIACNATATSSGSSLTVKCDKFNDSSNNPSDPFKKTDVGGIAGIGLAGRAFGREVSAQARYGRGFTNVASDDLDTTQKPKNSVISVVFGFGR